MVMSYEHGWIFPEDALPCVWMSAGLIAYRLCDREFDCDGCPLDLALRGVSPTTQSDNRTAVPAHHAAEFPEDRVYSTGHLWLQECPDNGTNFRVTEVFVRVSRLEGDDFVDSVALSRLTPPSGDMGAGVAGLMNRVAPDRKKPGVNPLDTGPFSAEVGPQPEAYRWRIEGARGYAFRPGS